MANTVRVWDLPTRIFHWSLVLCFIGLIITGEIAGEAMIWHFRLGYSVLALLLFRILWGIMGGRWSRFVHFVPSPFALLRYLKGQGTAQQEVGHNPLGALSVLALLSFLTLQVVAGLFSDDEIATSGPLAKMVAGAWVSTATFFHTEIGKTVLLVLVGLHVAAIAFYRLKKGVNLVQPMITGDKVLADPVESARDDLVSRSVALVLMGGCAALVVWLVRWAG
jgi:cytochrome b